MRHSIRCALVLLAFAANAQAQTMFRCQDGNRTVYSDRPCWSGTEVKRMTPAGGPTPEDVAKAQMKARAEDRASSKPQPPTDAAAKRKAPLPEKSAALTTR